jgi:hypothetical protein
VPRVVHLVSRFFGSLRPRALDAETAAWVADALRPEEMYVWEGLGAADRAEAVAVAQRLELALAGTADAANGNWIAAALLHDVGKQASAYGPIGRALVTVIVAGSGGERAREWATEPGPVRARIGRYAAHDDVGADLLRLAGARPEAVAWAEAHHRPDRWRTTGIPPGICRALAIADGEPGS